MLRDEHVHSQRLYRVQWYFNHLTAIVPLPHSAYNMVPGQKVSEASVKSTVVFPTPKTINDTDFISRICGKKFQEIIYITLSTPCSFNWTRVRNSSILSMLLDVPLVSNNTHNNIFMLQARCNAGSGNKHVPVQCACSFVGGVTAGYTFTLSKWWVSVNVIHYFSYSNYRSWWNLYICLFQCVLDICSTLYALIRLEARR